MATKSFLKNVNLRNRRECQDFIRALERSSESSAKDAEKRNETLVRDMDKETIRRIFCQGEST